MARPFGDGGIQYPRAIAVDAHGNVVIAGEASSIDFGNGPIDAALYVAKLSADGTLLWSEGFGDGVNTVQGIAVSDNGDVAFGGGLWGSIDFGGGVLTSNGEDDAFVAKLQR